MEDSTAQTKEKGQGSKIMSPEFMFSALTHPISLVFPEQAPQVCHLYPSLFKAKGRNGLRKDFEFR